MHPFLRAGSIATVLALSALQAGAAAESGDPRYVRAFAKLYTTARLGGLVKAWCDARAPLTRETTETALAAWKAAHRLDDVEARAEAVLGVQQPSINASVEARRESVFRALDKDSKDPAGDCRQMLDYLNRSADPARVNPAEFRLVERERARAAAAPRPEPGPLPLPVPATVATQPPAGAPAPGARGTVYTVAQLAAFVALDERTATARLRQLGPLTVQGTLEAYDETRPDETVWLNTLADGWRSTLAVLCHDLSFRRLYDANRRALTVRGTVRSVESWIKLQDCQVLNDGAGLNPSPLSDAGGLERIAVKPDQIRTAPNRGVALADIEGLYQPKKLRYNPQTLLFEPDETTYLVLKDGWLYDNLAVSPHDLDVAESRRLEPQNWSRWRRRGSEMEIQSQDEHGRTDGQWSVLELVQRAPIGARRLDGVFSAMSSATAGLAGGGGATVIGRTSYTFRPDGRFTWGNFTQGFASSNNGTGPGGASIVVGGASVGPGGTSVSTVGGGEDEGTYVTEGYTLELRTRSGKVHRFPIFSWDDGKYRDQLVINGTTYSPPK
jgi:hypothetical protein